MASLCIILIKVYINMFCVLKKGDVSFMQTNHMFDREKLKIIIFLGLGWGGGGGDKGQNVESDLDPN